ncbi:MAG TPA: hypothetical protein VFB00_01285 [Terriglobales bacterium]|nr:hypothetical protein [Terriglobales bacterium]
MLTKWLRPLQRSRKRAKGTVKVEFILIIALIALPILIALITFRNTIKGWFNKNAQQVQQTDQQDPGNPELGK